MEDQNYRLIPGFQSSRGDQIIPALCSLLKKMKDLEQPQISEPGRKDVGTNPDYSQSESPKVINRDHENRLIGEIKLKLLAAQIYSITCLLHKKYPKTTRNVRTNTEEAMFCRPQTTNSTNVFDDDLDQIPVKLMPTNSVKYQNTHDAVKESGYFASSSSSITDDQIHLNEHQKQSNARMKQLKPVLQKTRTSVYSHSNEKKHSIKRITKESPKGSKDRHFRMKLSKVPFILGTVRNNCSTTASHSLTANVQNIIWTLKMHNNFCAHQSPSPHTCSTPKIQKKPDYPSVLRNLGKDFSKLSLQQKNLKEQLSENKDRPEKKIIQEKYKNISDLLQTKAQEIVECHTQTKSERLLSTKTKLKTRPSSEPFSIPRWEPA